MTTNDHSGGFAAIDVGDPEPPPGSAEGFDIGVPFGPEPPIPWGESKPNGHLNHANGVVAVPHDRYQPFGLNELQRAYIVGRSKEIPLGGIGCQLHVEYVRPALDPVRFERTWNALIRRNEILRLVIEGAEHQRILPEVPWFEVPVISITGSDPRDVEAGVADIRDAMARHVYDVAVWPLHDVRIAMLPDGTARLFFSFDLIGIDAASAFQLSGLLAKGYESALDQDDWSPPAVGYREHRIAEISRWGEATWQRDRAFWQNLLPSLPAGPQLPYAAPFGDLTPPRFRRVARSLDRTVVQKLESAAAKHGLTPAKVINAAFAEVIATWSSERQFLLNLPIFLGPDEAGSPDPILGNHTTTVLVAADMRAGTFADRARGLWRSLARALRHRSYSGVNVLQDLRRLRREGFAPIAPVVLTNLMTHPEQSGWPTDTHNSVTYTPQVTLDHQVLPTANALLFHWDSVVGAFHPGVIEAMADAHMSLLARLAQDDAAWSEPSLCVLGLEQRDIRARVNATARSFEPGLLHDGFFAAARRNPHSPALIEGDRTVSYGELAALAEGVRRKLAENGVGPGEPVCCALPHGIDLAAVALGTLAHGAVYAPLDPASPAHRRRREVDILKARVAFVDAMSAKGIADLGLRTIEMQSVAAVAETQPQLHRTNPDDRAYVIFTSGTTGDPKAIVISHRGATNTCADLVDRFSLGPQDRVLALSAPTFDLSVFDLFGLWAAGGCAVLPAAESRLDPAAWVAAIETHGVTIWNTVPALMTMLAAHCEGREQTLRCLRLIMLSGDWIPPPLVPRMAGIAPAARLFSLGGATEASIWSILHAIAPEDAALSSIPYGVPLLNQTIHVLDETLAERPDHVEGDIFIGGVGLAEGYLGDPARTADAFITHPGLGTRLYRTGDRGRRRPDGVVEFLGRRDTQLKCQGFRIEAGEVEAALRGADGVADAVVEAMGDRFDTKRLVAFVVPECREELAPGADTGAKPKRNRPAVRTFDQPKRRIALARELAAEDLATMTGRRSARAFDRKAVALDDLARLLTPLRHVETATGPKYRYPSASGIYPVQAYLYCEPDRVEGLEAGLYYVDPAGDLVLLSTERIATPALHVAHNRDLAANAAFTLLLFAHMPAIAPSYGPLARDLCLLEAGYIGQALMETATETPCGLCPIGAMAFTTIAAAAGLSSEAQFLHAFVGGVRAEEAGESVIVAPQAAAPAIGDDLVARLREHAASRLPAYMLPNDIILVDQFPLSANQKVDRGALRALAAARLNDVKPARPPSTEVERRLTGIAARLLNLETIDIDREFFAMGADSVKLVEFSAAIEKEFGHRFQVIDAFANPTIRKLAAHLSSGAAAGAASDPLVSRARRRAESRRHTRPRQDGNDG